MNGRAFSQAEILDEMCLGGLGGDQAEGGGDRKREGQSGYVCHFLWILYL